MKLATDDDKTKLFVSEFQWLNNAVSEKVTIAY